MILVREPMPAKSKRYMTLEGLTTVIFDSFCQAVIPHAREPIARIACSECASEETCETSQTD